MIRLVYNILGIPNKLSIKNRSMLGLTHNALIDNTPILTDVFINLKVAFFQ